MPAKDLVAYYCTCIRSSLDCTCPVFYYFLPKSLQADLERVQKRALACIFPGISYAEALGRTRIVSVRDHQDVITKQLFGSICKRENNELHNLQPNTCSQIYDLRRRKHFTVPFSRIKRFVESLIIKRSTQD